MSAVPAVAASTASYEVPPEINDTADLFSDFVKREARQSLRQIRYHHRALILVETVKSLEGEALNDAAQRRARPLGASGIHVLMTAETGRPRDVAVTFGSNKTLGRVADPDRAAIRAAFLGPFQAGAADEGLERGIRAIDVTLAGAAPPKSRLQDAVLPVTIFATLLVVLLAIQAGTGDEDRSKRRRRSPSLTRESAVLPNGG